MFDKSNELVTRLVHFSKNILVLKYGLPERKMVKTISTGAGKLYFTMNNVVKYQTKLDLFNTCDY